MTQAHTELKSLSLCEREAVVIIPKETIAKNLEQAYKHIGKNAHLKGFRPGKVPRLVLEQYYKPQAEKEALNASIEAAYEALLQEHQLKPITSPFLQPKSPYKPNEDFELSIQIEVRPSIENLKWEGLELSIPSFEVNPDQVDQQLAILQREYATITPTDRTVLEMGDLVECQVMPLDETDKNQQRLAKMLENIELKEDFPLPSLVKDLLGASLEETKELQLEISETFWIAELKGQTVSLRITPKAIKIRQLAPLDDEFAKDMGPEFQTLEQLKERILQVLTQNAQQNEKQAIHQATRKAFIQANPLELPKRMVENQASQDIAAFLSQFGEGKEKKVWEAMGDKLKADALISAQEKVHVQLLCEHLAQTQALEASEDELARFVLDEAQKQQIDIKKFVNQIDPHKLKEFLRREKAFQLIIEKAHITRI